jgi:hypothetical protein
MKLMIKAAAIGLAIVALGACKKTDVNENVVANTTDNTAAVDMNATTTNVTTTTTNATDMNAAAPAMTNTTTTTTNTTTNAM